MKKDEELLEAARKGNLIVVEKLLAASRSSTRSFAASFGIKVGPNVNCQDQSGYTPMHHAALNGHRAIVTFLLRNAASVNTSDVKGSYPLHLGAWSGYHDIVNTLLTHGPSVAKVNEKNGDSETALHCASQHGHSQTVQVLLKNGADPSIRNIRNESPLDLASQYGRLDVVRLLLLHQPSLLKRHPDCFSPLHLASRNGHREVVELLIAHGADVNRSGENGTALHEAALFGKSEVVRLLLTRGANPYSLDPQNRTPLELVKQLDTQTSRDISQLILYRMQEGEDYEPISPIVNPALTATGLRHFLREASISDSPWADPGKASTSGTKQPPADPPEKPIVPEVTVEHFVAADGGGKTSFPVNRSHTFKGFGGGWSRSSFGRASFSLRRSASARSSKSLPRLPSSRSRSPATITLSPDLSTALRQHHPSSTMFPVSPTNPHKVDRLRRSSTSLPAPALSVLSLPTAISSEPVRRFTRQPLKSEDDSVFFPLSQTKQNTSSHSPPTSGGSLSSSPHDRELSTASQATVLSNTNRPKKPTRSKLSTVTSSTPPPIPPKPAEMTSSRKDRPPSPSLPPPVDDDDEDFADDFKDESLMVKSHDIPTDVNVLSLSCRHEDACNKPQEILSDLAKDTASSLALLGGDGQKYLKSGSGQASPISPPSPNSAMLEISSALQQAVSLESAQFDSLRLSEKDGHKKASAKPQKMTTPLHKLVVEAQKQSLPACDVVTPIKSKEADLQHTAPGDVIDMHSYVPPPSRLLGEPTPPERVKPPLPVKPQIKPKPIMMKRPDALATPSEQDVLRKSLPSSSSDHLSGKSALTSSNIPTSKTIVKCNNLTEAIKTSHHENVMSSNVKSVEDCDIDKENETPNYTAQQVRFGTTVPTDDQAETLLFSDQTTIDAQPAASVSGDDTSTCDWNDNLSDRTEDLEIPKECRKFRAGATPTPSYQTTPKTWIYDYGLIRGASYRSRSKSRYNALHEYDDYSDQYGADSDDESPAIYGALRDEISPIHFATVATTMTREVPGQDGDRLKLSSRRSDGGDSPMTSSAEEGERTLHGDKLADVSDARSRSSFYDNKPSSRPPSDPRLPDLDTIRLTVAAVTSSRSSGSSASPTLEGTAAGRGKNKDEWAQIADVISELGGSLNKGSVYAKEFQETFWQIMTGSSLPRQISTWLSELGLPQYESVLIGNGFDDVDFLADDVLEERDLIDMDVTDSNHRRRILDSAQNLPKLTRVPPFDSASASLSVDQWLTSLHLPQYVATFESEGFHKMTQVRGLTEQRITKLFNRRGHAKRVIMSLQSPSVRSLRKPSSPQAKSSPPLSRSPLLESVNFFKDYNNIVNSKTTPNDAPNSGPVSSASSNNIDSTWQHSPVEKPSNSRRSSSNHTEVNRPRRRRSSSRSSRGCVSASDRRTETSSTKDSTPKSTRHLSELSVFIDNTSSANSQQKLSSVQDKESRKMSSSAPPVTNVPDNQRATFLASSSDGGDGPGLNLRPPNETTREVSVSAWRHPPEVLINSCCNYQAYYLGSMLIPELKGVESTKEACAKMRRSTDAMKKIPTITLSVNYRGVKFIDFKSKHELAEHEIQNISFASQDADDLSTFAYITHDVRTGHHYCHVFRVTTMDMAYEVILTLGQAFEVAYQLILKDNALKEST